MLKKDFSKIASILKKMEIGDELFALFAESGWGISMTDLIGNDQKIEFHPTSWVAASGTVLLSGKSHTIFIAPMGRTEGWYERSFSACPLRGVLPVHMLGNRMREAVRLLGVKLSGGLFYIAAQRNFV